MLASPGLLSVTPSLAADPEITGAHHLSSNVRVQNALAFSSNNDGPTGGAQVPRKDKNAPLSPVQPSPIRVGFVSKFFGDQVRNVRITYPVISVMS